MILFLGLVCVAFLLGVLIGWSWKPKWAVVDRDQLGSSVSKSIYFWYRFFMTLLKGICLNLSSGSVTVQLQPVKDWVAEDETYQKVPSLPSPDTPLINEEKPPLITEKDLEHLFKLVEVTDGGPAWEQMMNRFTQTMHYQAWRREPKIGPPQYRTRTVFENATPEMVRDFFWDDEFRTRWDDMLRGATTVEECLTTGSMVVNWIRKFPFFCSDREYMIGRRIWESERTYYCVTKGVPYPSISACNKHKRVDMYYSSWCIQAVESRGDGLQSACEVNLFHHEEMGIPREIAKLGIRQGMWGAVKKLEPGLRAYQVARASGSPLSQCASMAQVNTKIDPEYLKSLGGNENIPDSEKIATSCESLVRKNIPKVLVLGGAAIVACSVSQGLLPNAVIFAVAKGLGNIGKKGRVVRSPDNDMRMP